MKQLSRIPAAALLAGLIATANLLAPAAPALAAEDEQRIYDIEVVIFANRDVPRGNNVWERQMLVPDLHDAVGLDGGPASRADFIALGDEGLRLLAEAEMLRRSSRYDLLLHRAWRQPGLPRESRIAVEMHAGQPIEAWVKVPSAADAALPMADAEVAAGNLPAVADQPPEAADAGNQPVLLASDSPPAYNAGQFGGGANYARSSTAELNGSIAIGLGRYLHAHTDLVYTEPAPPQRAPQSATDTLFAQQLPAWQSHRVRDHRRMRSRELHYLDHPKLGVLILITPYEAESAAGD